MTSSDGHARRNRDRFAIGAALVVALASAAPLSAQGNETPCDRYGSVPVTFVGVAGEPTQRSFFIAADVGRQPIPVTPMTVTRNYRGAEAAILYLNLPGIVTLKPGRSYLIYGFDTNFGEAREVIALGAEPKPIERAAEDLAFLDAALANMFATLHGTLTRESPDKAGSARQPLPGIAIRFSSDSGFYAETITGQSGEYTVRGIPPGRVRIEPIMPDGSIVPAKSAEARSGGCTAFDLVVPPRRAPER